MKIVVPKIISKETLCISCLSSLLILRTIFSIYISEVNGSIVKSIVEINSNKFLQQMIILGLYSIPSAIINSLLEYLNKILGLFFRQNLTKYLHNKYLSGMCYYQITNLDNRIQNPDQIFTNDIEKLSYAISNLYSNFAKPLLDVVLFTRKLTNTIGIEGPIILISWYIFTVIIMRYISPPFGKLTAIEQSHIY